MENAGYNVLLSTFEKTDWTTIEKYYGEYTKPDKEIVGPRLLFDFTYGKMMNFSLLSLKTYKCSDLIIISSTSPNVFGILNAYPYCNKKFIVYANMLPSIHHSIMGRLYYLPYISIQRRILRKTNNICVLANSSFTAESIRKTFGLNPIVVYPPVDIENFHSSKKQDLIVSVGRFNSFKRFETLIKSLAHINEGKCIIMGSIARNAVRESVMYERKLRRMINDLKLQDRVNLLVNCPFALLSNTLAMAKVYVNCTLFEPFGIGVVEGMASGCVPIVYRSGGPYLDIVDHDKYGFSFKDAKELAEKMSILLKDDDLCQRYSRQAINRSKLFSRENFKKRILNLVESNL